MPKAPILVTLFVRNGKLVTEPDPVRVDPGDRVAWKSDDGDLTVSFPSNKNPFTADMPHRAKKGVTTSAAEVRPDVSKPDSFKCTITIIGDTIGDKKFEGATGVDTPGTPP